MNSKIRNFVYMGVVAILLLIIACATTGPGGKKSLILIGTETEVSLGMQMNEQVRQENKILADTVWQNYVTGIGQKIVAVCDRKDITYQFAVIESDQINAFAAPGGYIFFYTGLLKTMENEAELAAVMAHEISHVVARHGIKRMQTAMGVNLVQQLILGDQGEALNAAVGIGMGLLFADYSRDDENEADNYGVIYMTRAGYNPEACLTMFEKISSQSDGSANFFEKLTRSHPETQERISHVRGQIQGMSPLPQNLTLGTDKYRQMKGRLK